MNLKNEKLTITIITKDLSNRTKYLFATHTQKPQSYVLIRWIQKNIRQF
jgi:hypothetical protein